MPFEWIDRFQQSVEKSEDYAEKTLAAYSLGMKAGGAIRGVSIRIGDDCCAAARRLPQGEVYTPGQAPHLPLPECPLGKKCRCVYRPVMDYPEGPG
jgi:hypothetical protein